MKQYPHVQINLTYQEKEGGVIKNEIVNAEIVKSKQPSKNIQVVISPDELSVQDNGTGIMLKTALLKLLVPSSSTKGAASLTDLREKINKQDTQSPQLVARKKDVPGGDKSRFIMTVNNVTVVNKIMPTVRDKNGDVCDLIIPLPQAVQLTLARDDLEIGQDGNSFEENYLKRMVDETVDKALGLKEGEIDPNMLSVLYDGLKTWEDLSAAHHIKGRFSGSLKSSLEEKIAANNKLVPLPRAYAEVLGKMLPSGDNTYVTLNESLVNYNFSRVEDALHETLSVQAKSDPVARDAADEKLIQGQRVYFVDDAKLPKNKNGKALIETFGLKGVLFVPKSILKGSADATCNEIQSAAGDCVLLGKDDEVKEAPVFIFNTYADSMVPTLPDGRRFFDQTEDMLYFEWFLNNQNLFKYGSSAFEQWQKGDFYRRLVDPLFPRPKKSIFLNMKNDQRIEYLVNIILFPYGYSVNTNGKFFLGRGTNNLERLVLDSNEIDIHRINRTMISLFIGLLDSNVLTLDRKNHALDWLGAVKEWMSIELGALITSPYSVYYIPESDDLWHIFNFQLVPRPKPVILKDLKYNQSIVICVKDASDEQIESIQKRLYSVCARVAKYVVTLQSAIDGVPNVYGPFIWASEVGRTAGEQLSTESAIRIDSMVSIFNGLYERYLQVDNNELCRTYGEGNVRDNAVAGVPDVGAQDIVTMLQKLDVENLVKKIMVLQNSDLVFQMDIGQRAQDLTQHRFYIPSILSNTPCSLLTKIYQASDNAELIQKIVEMVANPEELSFLCYVLLSDQNKEFLKQADKAKLAANVGNLIEHFIRERVDQDEMRSIYEQNRAMESLSQRLENFKNKSIVKLVHDYLDQVLNQVIFFQTLEAEPVIEMVRKQVADKDIWLLSHLMRAHTRGEGLEPALKAGDIKAVAEKIKTIDKPLDVGKITQAVEAGSEKSPIEASIVECLQNSVDAVRGFFKNLESGQVGEKASYDLRKQILQDDTGKTITDQGIVAYIATIDYELATVKTKDPSKNHMLLSMTDHVGMPGLETLLTDLILPDYSNKSRAQGNVGDMGNGTFKLYQDATVVTFVTRSVRDPKRVFLLLVEPERNADGLVVDLKLRCCDVSDPSQFPAFSRFFGTKISVLFRPQEVTNNNLQLFATRNFLFNSCGATNVPIKYQTSSFDLALKLTTNEGSERFNQTPTLIWKHMDSGSKTGMAGGGGNVLFTGYRRVGRQLQSYLTTNGIPFRPLHEVIKQLNLLPENLSALITDGIIIDLGLDTYQPVQSRTQLKMPPDREKMLKEELAKCCREVAYQEGIDRAKDDEHLLDLYFTHYLSQAEYEQLVPSASGAADLKTAFDQKQNFVPLTTFFRFYQSLDPVALAFDQGVKSYFASIKSQVTPCNLEQELTSWLSTVETRIQQVVTQNNEAEKSKIRNEWQEKMSDIIIAWKSNTDAKLKECHDTFAAIGSNASPLQKQLKTIILGWVDKKMNNLSPDTLPLSWLFAKYPGLETKAEIKQKQKDKAGMGKELGNVQAVVQAAVQKTGSSITVDAVLKHLFNSYLKSYCNCVRDALKLPHIHAEFEIGKNESTLGYWNGSELRINLPVVSSIIAQLELICKLLEGKTGSIPTDNAYTSLFAVAKGKAPTVAHELEHARRHALHSSSGSHDEALDADGNHAKFDASALRSIAIARENDLLKNWSDAMIKQFPGMDVKALRDTIKQLAPLEQKDKKLLAETILGVAK